MAELSATTNLNYKVMKTRVKSTKAQKEQMMAKAINAECFGFHQGAALFSFKLPSDNYLVGSKVKVIVIKED